MEIQRRDTETGQPVREVRTAALHIATDKRNGTLDDLVDMLKVQHDLKYDVVVPASRINYQGGKLTVFDGASVLSDHGVTLTDAYLNPTHTFEDGVSAKLGIPRKYMSRMRDAGYLGLLDENVNAWLRGSDADQQYLVRGFRTDDPGQTGVARAFLSDQYMFIDHLDGLMAALAGIKDAGVDAQVTSANLSDRSMVVNLQAPEITALAPEFLGDYVSPFTGQTGRDLPVISAGLQIRNSEVGSGAYTIVPRVVIEVCKNGMTRVNEQIRRVHLGTKLEQGEVRWSEDTKYHYIELVKGQTRDAVMAFLSPEWIQAQADRLEDAAGIPITKIETVERIIKPLSFSEGETAQLVDLFMTSGDHSAGGIAQAVSAMAVDHPVIERAVELEDMVFDVLEFATVGAAR